jgi:hypothetical protein
MVLKYDIDIQETAITENLKRLTNQIYKLLPGREENLDWQTPLTTIMEELGGMDALLIDHHDVLFPLLCKYFIIKATICQLLHNFLKKDLTKDIPCAIIFG